MENVIEISYPYKEPTQWCVDVFVNGTKTQLTFQHNEKPTQEQVDNVVATFLENLENFEETLNEAR